MMRSYAVISFVLILLLGVFNHSNGQEAKSLTLDECVELALANNDQLQLKQLQIDIERNDYGFKRRFFMPDVKAYARYFQYLDNFPVYVFPDNENATLSGNVQLGAPLNFFSGFTVNQTMFDTRLINGRSLRLQSEELLDRKSELNEDQTIFDVSKTFFEIGIIEQGKTIIDFNEKRLEKMATIAQVSVENSLSPKSTLVEIEIRIDELQLKRKQLEFGLDQSKNYLKFLCGIDEAENIELVYSEQLPEITSYEGMDTIQSKESAIINLQKELNQRSILHEASKTYPTVDLFLAFQWLQQEGYGELFTQQGDWFNQHYFGLQLNVPIVSSEDRKSKRQTVKIRNDLLEAQQNLVEKTDKIKREKAIQDLQIAGDALSLQEKKISLYETKYTEQEVKYNEDFSSLPDLLDAEEKVLNAKMEYQQKKLEYFVAILEVYKSFGMIRSINDSQ